MRDLWGLILFLIRGERILGVRKVAQTVTMATHCRQHSTVMIRHCAFFQDELGVIEAGVGAVQRDDF